MLLEYYRVRPSATPPTRANPSDAGLDIHFSPEEPCTTMATIKPGSSMVLPTGLKFGVPHGYMLEVKNRSGVAAKRGLLVGACVIDSGYDGEVFINLHNVGTEEQHILPGTKIAQVVMVPIIHFRARKVMADSLYDNPICISNRGTGGFGSTGTS